MLVSHDQRATLKNFQPIQNVALRELYFNRIHLATPCNWALAGTLAGCPCLSTLRKSDSCITTQHSSHRFLKEVGNLPSLEDFEYVCPSSTSSFRNLADAIQKSKSIKDLILHFRGGDEDEYNIDDLGLLYLLGGIKMSAIEKLSFSNLRCFDRILSEALHDYIVTTKHLQVLHIIKYRGPQRDNNFLRICQGVTESKTLRELKLSSFLLMTKDVVKMVSDLNGSNNTTLSLWKLKTTTTGTAAMPKE